MTKEELLDILKEHLTIQLDYFRGNDWETKSLSVKLFIDDEEICKCTEYIYD